MPTYRYRCAKCGDEVEIWQSFSDKPLSRHNGGCGGKLAKVMSPAGIVLKGSGFYKTDNRSSKGKKSSSEGSGSKSDSGSDSKSSTSSGEGSGGLEVVGLEVVGQVLQVGQQLLQLLLLVSPAPPAPPGPTLPRPVPHRAGFPRELPRFVAARPRRPARGPTGAPLVKEDAMLRRSPRALLLWGAALAVAAGTGAVVAGDLATLHRRAGTLGPERPALVAARDLAVGTTVTDVDVRTRRLHRSELPPGVLGPRETAIGRVVTVPVLRGAFVAERNLAPRRRTGVDGAIPQGTRAVRVVVADSVRPRAGAAVDVLVAAGSGASIDPAALPGLSPTGTGTSGSAAVVVARGVLVLAVDDDGRTGSGSPAAGRHAARQRARSTRGRRGRGDRRRDPRARPARGRPVP